MADRAFVNDLLSGCTVGIAGCGGLGSNCAMALARTGIGKLVLVDYDFVEMPNLNRQYYFLHQVGVLKVEALKENILQAVSNIELDVVNLRVEREHVVTLFKNCDVIVEAFDNAEYKQMLIETVHELLPGTPLVSAVGVGGWGNSNRIKCEKYGNLYVCGDAITEMEKPKAPLAPKVGAIAALQANVVLEILLNSLNKTQPK